MQEHVRKKADFADALATRIRSNGPISVAEYMEQAVAHYYNAHDSVGARGDFTTAPEISQVFGEMLAVWFADIWMQAGKPDNVKLIELGPGRGTLAADILRVFESCGIAASLHLVETSQRLRHQQGAKLSHLAPAWYTRLVDVPPGYAFIVANEFFDALPIHQFEKTPHGWMERMVGWDNGFVITYAQPTSAMPRGTDEAEIGHVLEICPAGISACKTLAQRIEAHGGAALLIDYGHVESGYGDTLQAMSRHGYARVLDNPGRQDITAHVDFATLASAITPCAQIHGPATQGDFLTALGITQRCEILLRKGTVSQNDDLKTALYRLTAPSEMGLLFKVMGVTQKGNKAFISGFDHASIPDNGA